MIISAIAAIGEDNALGKDNGLLWDLPNDQDFLKSNIKNTWVLSGRKSYESALGTELFTRRQETIIITRQLGYEVSTGYVAHSVEEVLDLCEVNGVKRLSVLGGAAVYEAMMPYTNQLIITRVHGEFPAADTYFPRIDPALWRIKRSERYKKDDQHAYDYSFVYYDRNESND